MLTPQQVSEKWSRNLSGSAEQIRQGVQAVTTSPGEVAIQRKQSYIDGVNRSFTDGTYERGQRSYTLEDWKRMMVEKGVARISGGATAAKPRMEAFMSQWLPVQAELSRRIQNMPKGSLADSQARAAAAIEHNAAYRGKFRSR
jgi:hypothetical protein